jgi:hypothetical protein
VTRANRIAKLSHAIWEYRGRYDPASGKWWQTPKPRAVVRIRKWLEALGVIDIEVTVIRIEGFKSQEEFHSFLKELEPAR